MIPIIYFPCRKPNENIKRYNFVPNIYKNCGKTNLEELGFVFKSDDFFDLKTGLSKGVVSYDRTMVVGFCDLKGSTQALRVLKTEQFREVQDLFFDQCNYAVMDGNKIRKSDLDENSRYPRAVVDKFMGDCMMFYIDCGNTPKNKSEKNYQKDKKNKTAIIDPIAAKMAIRIISKIVNGFSALETDILSKNKIVLGARFGIALGDEILLSIIGQSRKDKMITIGDFTLTGEAVNLAARLEHATPDEFLSAISDQRQQAEAYINSIASIDSLHGTELGRTFSLLDQQVVDLYEVMKRRFEIRIDERFKMALDANGESFTFPWKKVPFAPRGFFRNHSAFLLGGNTGAELFQIV